MQNGLLPYALGFVLAGFLSGFLSGLFNVGSIVRIPIFYVTFLLLGVGDSILMHMAIGTSLALSIPATLKLSRARWRDWNNDIDRKKIFLFIRKCLTYLVLGSVLAIFLIAYVPGWVLLAVYLFAVLSIAVNAFVLRGNFYLLNRFPGRFLRNPILTVAGAISTLSGIPGSFIDAFMRAFGYYAEAVYIQAAGGLAISIIGALGYAAVGMYVLGRPPYSLGYVNMIAMAVSIPAIILATRLGRKAGSSPGIKGFKKSLTAERLTDVYTGLYSRTYFDHMLDHSLACAGKYSEPVSVLMIDVDNLTVLNKTHGERAVNSVLSYVAGVLNEFFSKADTAARYGGDEFTVILERTGKNGAITAAENLCRKFGETAVEPNPGIPPVSISIGISTSPGGEANCGSLVSKAEQAMYASKHSEKRITHYEDIPASEDGQASSLGEQETGGDYFSARSRLLSPPLNHKQLSPGEIWRAGRALADDPSDLRLFGMHPLVWYALGFRVLGRTAVEVTRDKQSMFLARSAADTLGSNGFSVADVIDPFVGSGNLFFHVLRAVHASRGVGLDTNGAVVDLTKRNFSRLRRLGRLGVESLELHEQDWTHAADYLESRPTLVVIDPPWGEGFDAHGLDLRKTAPPVSEILEALSRRVGEAPVFVMIKIHPMMVAESVEEIKKEYYSFPTLKSDDPDVSSRVDYVLLRLYGAHGQAV